MWRKTRTTALITMLLATMLTQLIPGPASAQDSANVNITFRGCPDGADPTVDASGCDTPLDAPDASRLDWESGTIAIGEMERQADGSYSGSIPADTLVIPNGFEPSLRDNFMFAGAQDQNNAITNNDPYHPGISLDPGANLSFTVYYWNGADGPSDGDAASLDLTIRGCPEGVNPEESSDPLAECTTPLDAPPAMTFSTGSLGDQIVADAPRLDDGTYQFEGIDPFQQGIIHEVNGTEHNRVTGIGPVYQAGSGATNFGIDFGRGDQVEVTLLYWNDGASTPPDNGNGDGSASLAITFRGCPDGVDPYAVDDPAAECTTPLDAPEAAYAAWDPTSIAITDFEREADGTYVLGGIDGPAEVTFGGFEPTAHESYGFFGTDWEGDDVAGLTLDNGEAAQITVYYYNTGSVEIPEGTGTVELTMRGCPDGVDPRDVADPHAECTIPLDAPDASYLAWGSDSVSIAGQPRLDDGTYQVSDIAAPDSVEIGGLEPTERNSFVVFGADSYEGPVSYVDLGKDETASLTVFYFNA